MPRLGGRLRVRWLMAGVAVVAMLCAVFRDGGSPGFVIALIASGVLLAACAYYSEVVAWRVTSRWMIGATAAVAVVLAAAPDDELQGDRFAAVIVGGSVLALAYATGSEAVTRVRGRGFEASELQKVCIFLGCVPLATTIIGASLFAFQEVFFLWHVDPMSRFRNLRDVTEGVILGTVAAVCVATFLRLMIQATLFRLMIGPRDPRQAIASSSEAVIENKPEEGGEA
ncbi:hypothetical protein [Paludisphaera borealis]|uniref:Uncharacterized protein n=1 Tax=Paludisphaera borealis TaxID=1387353 RepID=A0A1U7CRJ3_9BACT|nr:hypothetical protein [Paludisphaera borealis]APW61552.1 hypothetical protein BSF38_03070 [Paludisphaera borealis]